MLYFEIIDGISNPPEFKVLENGVKKTWITVCRIQVKGEITDNPFFIPKITNSGNINKIHKIPKPIKFLLVRNFFIKIKSKNGTGKKIYIPLVK